MSASIIAIEYYYPEKKLTSADLALEFPGYDFSKFESKIGIKNRYVVEGNETALDLAVKACEKLFLRVDKEKIDFILYCTQSPEYFLPTSACILQDRVGLRRNIGALDFNLGCSGFVYGLSLAKGLIEAGQASNVLLVTAETYSKFLHPDDRSNRSIFGDAATCTLISKSEVDGVNNFLFGTDGSGFDKLIVKNGAGKNSFNEDANQITYGSDNVYSDNHLYMNGPEIMSFTTEVIPEFCKKVIEKNQMMIQDIDQFVFHQANAFMLNLLRKKVGAEKEKFYIDLEDGGNTVSNTIPIALKKYAEGNHWDGLQHVVVVGFGVGLSWAGGMIKLQNNL